MKSLFCLCILSAFVSYVWTKPPKGVNPDIWYWCNWSDSFTPEQLEFCVDNPRHMIALVDGGSQAMEACQNLFQYEKWNCSQGVKINSYVNYGINDGSREDGFLQAIQSAGMTYEIVLKCIQGELPKCGCTNKSTTMVDDEVCVETVDHAVKVVNQFLKWHVMALPRTNLQLMALHNIRLGQQSVKHFLKQRCHCNGTDDNTEICICHKGLPLTFDPIAKHIQSKYQTAHQAVSSPDDHNLMHKKRNTAVNRNHMIFLSESKDPCSVESPRGRSCLKPSNCDKICCNRGWRFVEKEITEECHCVITDELEIECESCQKFVSEHQCK